MTAAECVILAALGRAVVPLDGRLEAIDQTRLTELRKTTEKGN